MQVLPTLAHIESTFGVHSYPVPVLGITFRFWVFFGLGIGVGGSLEIRYSSRDASSSNQTTHEI